MITPSDALLKIPNPWRDLLTQERRNHVDQIVTRINAELLQQAEKGERIYPWACERFKALELSNPSMTRAVVIGQDPYHNLCIDDKGLERPQAMGLSFSVPRGAKVPPSLKNIFKELRDDTGVEIPSHGDLTAWADQGLLLLNSYLSVAHGKPGSHSSLGWHDVVKIILEAVSGQRDKNIVFVLWGKHAQQYEENILLPENHLIIKTSHPSPIGGACNKGFFGSRPFSAINQFLEKNGELTFNWNAINNQGARP